jgi:hypothetical protein
MIARGSQHNDLPPERWPSRLGLVAGLSGTLYALAAEVSISTLPPAPGSGAQQLDAYYAQHQATVYVTQLIEAAESVFLLVFVSALGAWLVRAHRGSSSLATLVTLAGVTVAAMGLMMNAVAISIGLNAARIEDGAVIQLFNDVYGATEILVSLPLSAIVVFISWALLKAAARCVGSV